MFRPPCTGLRVSCPYIRRSNPDLSVHPFTPAACTSQQQSPRRNNCLLWRNDITASNWIQTGCEGKTPRMSTFNPQPMKSDPPGKPYWAARAATLKEQLIQSRQMRTANAQQGDTSSSSEPSSSKVAGKQPEGQGGKVWRTRLLAPR